MPIDFPPVTSKIFQATATHEGDIGYGVMRTSEGTRSHECSALAEFAGYAVDLRSFQCFVKCKRG